MLKERITFTDYDGNERTEDFYFNLSQREVMKMEVGVTGGMSQMLQRIVDEKDIKRIMDIFEDIIIKAYGKKSEDGKQFIKSEELSKEFIQTDAYDVLFMKMLDADYASKFVQGILPAMPQDHLPGKTNQPIPIGSGE